MDGSLPRFRLERLRVLKEHSEQAAKQQLAQALLQREASQARLEHADGQLHSARAGQTAGAPRTAAELAAAQAYIERLERAQVAARDELGRHDEHVDSRRDELVSAARERQTLDKLKAHQAEQHRREADRRERAVLDEVAVTGHTRRAA